MKRILVIENDADVVRLLKFRMEDFYQLQVTYTTSYIEAMANIAEGTFDLYIIDYRLGVEKTGLDILRILQKKQNISNRVIMLSATVDDDLLVEAYDLGVSNFIIKPFSTRLLSAVLKKNLRMLADKVVDSLTVGEVSINFSLQTCQVLENEKSNLVSLTPIEFKILARLMESANRIVQKDELAFLGHDRNKAMSTKALEMHIVNLRRKSNVINKAVKTKRAIGYFFKN